MSLKSYALTTIPRTAEFIGIDNPSIGSTTYSVLENLINQVTEYIENYCGRRFKKTTYTNEMYDGDGSDSLCLKNFPIISTETVTLSERTSGLNEDDWETDDSDQYFIYYDSGIIKWIYSRHFIRGTQKYRVTYTAGYDFDNSSTFLSDTQAGDVEYVAWKLVATAWEQRKGSTGVESEHIGDYSVKYAKNVFENEDIKAILDKYKRFEATSYITPRNT